ncbi:creatine kinase, mitochondrial precursor [Thraustotheca clavata]|uniref:Creatine kinase, mitochondrial n=1 Tax=Thraustotheca clavata TaxID=74557 RepID=A0A1V9YJP2_9STRA|nr:creatine kinase, mitochondrial precursor [Thraustotheca clavata]
MTDAPISPRPGSSNSPSKMAQKIEAAQSMDGKLSGYPQFTPAHRSLMSKHLTREIYAKLKDVKTSTGYTLERAIQTGVDNPHLGVGITAGDEESYVLFKEIFDPVIEGWHGYKKDAVHKRDLDPTHLTDAKMPDEYIISTRIRAGRNIRGMPLPPATSRAHRKDVMNLLDSALTAMDGDLKGKFYKLSEMTPAEEQKLIDDHFLFQKPGGGTLLAAAGAARDWPFARGIFHNDEKTFLVWCNEEDHMRVISMQNGGDIGAVFERFCRAVKSVEDSIKAKGHEFMYDDHLGFIGTCPSNLGTGLRASVMIKLPKLSENLERFEKLCCLLNLQPRGMNGEHSASVGGVYDVSNKQRIGYSEAELVQTMINGIRLLIDLEKKLVAGESIDDLIPTERVPNPVIEAPKTTSAATTSIDVKPSNENSYPEFTPKHRSLMAKHLTPELYAKLKDVRTKKGYSLDDAIQTGIDNPHLGVGVVAGDEECYVLFKDLLDPVIEGWHGFKPTDTHVTDMDVSKLVNADKLDNNYIGSTRVRAGRNIKNLSLPPGTTRSERLQVEHLISTALSALEAELSGKYYPLGNMTKEEEDQLQKDHFLFQKPGGGTLLTGAGAARDWPSGRGIYHNVEKSFLVWVNEEDHMRVISMQDGGDIVAVFTRWVKGVKAVEESIKKNGFEFMHNEHLGFLGTCPSNLGTGLRASMFVKLIKLGEDVHKLEAICNTLGLQPRGSAGEHSAAVGGMWDISNKARIGKSEVELVQTMIDGVGKLIELEKAMEGGKSISDIMTELNLS